MAEIKFTQLPAGAVPTDADILASVQNISTTPISVQITFEQIASWIENKSFDSLNATTFFGVNTGGNDVFSARVDSEAFPRFYIIDNGQLTWSQGTSIAFDTRLFRPNASPSTLQIDNGVGGNANLNVIGNISTTNVNATTFFGVNTGGNDVFSARVDSEAYPRFYIIDNGQLTWSQGNSIAFDARLFRPNSTPNTLQIDNGAGGNADLIVTRNITCNTLNASLLNAPIPSQIDANKTYTYQSSVGTKTLRLASNSAVLTSQNVVVNNNTLTTGIINFASAGVIPSLSDTSVYLVREINGRFSGVSSYLQGTSLVPGQFNKVNFDKSGIATGNYQIDIWLLETAIPINLNNLNYFGVNPYLDVNFSSVNGITRDGNNAIVTVGHIIQNAGGTSLPNRSFLKFTGTGVSVTDGISGETLVTINGDGDVRGQPSSIERGIAFFSDTTGKQIDDSPWIFAGPAADKLYAPNGGTLQFLETTTPREIILSTIPGDTNLRMVIENTGLHKFSSGSGFYDLSFYRSGASTLKIDNNAGGGATLDLSNGTLSTTNVNATTFFGVNTGGNDVFSARVSTEAFPRFYIIDNGQLTWSQGTSIAFDTRLFRPNSTPNTLQIDDGVGGDANLIVTGDLTVDNVNLTVGGGINAVNIANAEIILSGYTGQPNFRYTLDREGLQKYSDGTASGYDLSLERSGVATLKLKNFSTNGEATIDTTNGTLIASTINSSSGDIRLNSSTSTVSIRGSTGAGDLIIGYGNGAADYHRLSSVFGGFQVNNGAGGDNTYLSVQNLIANNLNGNINNSPLTISTTGTTSGADIILNPGTGGNSVFRFNGTSIARFNSTGLLINNSGQGNITLGNTTSLATSTPVTIDMGGTVSGTPGSNIKLIIFNDGTKISGISSSSIGTTGGLEYITASGTAGLTHNFFTNGSIRTQINDSGVNIFTTTNQLVLGASAGNRITLTAPAPAASRTYTIPDAGGAASFVMTASNQTISGTKTFSSGVPITATTNQLVLGTTNTTTITAPAPSASRVYTIPDAGGAASFVMTAGNQTIAGQKTFSQTSDAFYTLFNGGTNGNIVIQSVPTQNGFMTINFNGFFNGGEQRINTSKLRYRFAVDQRSTTDSMTLESWNGTSSFVHMLLVPGTANQIQFPLGIATGASANIAGTSNSIIGGTSNTIPSTSSNCVLLGNNLTVAASRTNSIGIGNYINVNASGAVGIADNSTTTNLTLGDNTYSSRFAGGYVLWSNSTTTVGVQVAAGGNSWVAISDVRKKKDIVDIDCQDVYSKVKQLPVFTYKYIDDYSDQIRLGTSANEFNDLFGDEYIEKNIDKDGYNLISSADVTYVLLATVKELQNKVENLEKTLH